MTRLLLVFALAGCARAPGPPATTTVREWLAASAHDDPHAAYRLLSEATRRTVSEAEFTRRWRAGKEERLGQANALGPFVSRPPEERARSLWGDGRSATLVHEPDGWRLASPRFYASGAASPEEALQRFTEALERHDLDGLLDLLADPLRGLVERELSERLQRLKAAPLRNLQIEGDRARLRLDDRYRLELKQEQGRWRISDFN